MKDDGMGKIKIAQIGVSKYNHGRQIFESLKKQTDIFEIVGYALPEKEREKFPKQAACFDGHREMTVDEILNDPEIKAVTIETEEIYLTKYAMLAAQHGKHIHMEKPGSPDLKQFGMLVEIAKKNKILLHMGYMYRYNPCVVQLMEQVDKGEMGEIISVEAQMNCILPAGTRQWLAGFPGGMMFYLGCHLVDLILRLQGVPERVIPLNKCSQVEGVTAEDFGMAVFEYNNGVSFAKTSAVELGGFARRQLVVTGTKKTVELKPFEMHEKDGSSWLYTGKTEYERASWSDLGTYSRSAQFDRYDAMLAAFGAMVRGEKENPYTYEYELELFNHILWACGAAEAMEIDIKEKSESIRGGFQGESNFSK